MKKIFLYITILVFGLVLFASCEKEEIGGTKTEAMAGEWYVTAVAVDEDDNVVYEDADLFGIGNFHLDTYNSAADTESEMWIDDNTNFWEFKVKLNVDLATMTFSATDAENEYYESMVTVTNGRILYNAATTPSGSPADSIVFNVSFDDDTYPEAYGYAKYRIAGFRYTGLTNDD
ncbi:MAG: hypothetical protein JXR61_05695 [Prolixibacteraceae bacterium]|nr:hypothetical protein [Prolixibacteraceae bacterium]